MTTFLIIVCVLAFLVWLGRLLRRREQARFRDIDAQMLGDLRQEHNLEAPSSAPEYPSSIATGSEPAVDHEPNQPSNLDGLVTPTRRGSVLTELQYMTLTSLESVLKPGYRVLPNVPLSDFVTTASGARVSFLLCDGHLAPLLAIEFMERKNQDVSLILSQAQLPELQIDRDESQVHLRSRLLAIEPAWIEMASDEQRCPKCYGDMKLRAPKSGKHAGKRYWLCKAYPHCRGAVSA